ncbi:hypothetical protein TruAng_000514 [Truncatella angustata]|nr:hypothetical protein TruAng_000514 [Truncatella angustata]
MSFLLDDSKTKRFCLQAMLWSGLLFTTHARHTTSILGPPVKRDGSVKGDDLSTRTMTVSIAFKPTLAAGNANYELMGCYGQAGLDRSGHPFGKEADFASPSSVNKTELTPYSCLDGCMELSPPKGKPEHFKYAGLKNASECYCGMEIASGATKLEADNCTTPCSGENKLSCGGSDNLAVYSYAPDSKKAVASEPSTSATTDHVDEAIAVASTVPPAAITTTPPVDHAPASAAAVAAVTGSISGAVLMAALFFFCRAQRKKRNMQDEHVATILSKHQDDAKHNDKQPLGFLATNANVHDDIHLTIKGDMVPTTPALERGAKRATILPSALMISGARQKQTEDRDSLYSNLMHEVCSPPKAPSSSSSEGNSSAVQWRTVDHGGDGGAAPLSPRVTSPPPSAGIHGLGDRAWHRRRLSTTFAPPSFPLPPNPPRGRAGRGAPPPRPPRRGSVATFEVGRDTPVHSPLAAGFASTHCPVAEPKRKRSEPNTEPEPGQRGRGQTTDGPGAATGEKSRYDEFRQSCLAAAGSGREVQFRLEGVEGFAEPADGGESRAQDSSRVRAEDGCKERGERGWSQSGFGDDRWFEYLGQSHDYGLGGEVNFRLDLVREGC